MTTPADAPLLRHTAALPARPFPAALDDARRDVCAAAADLGTVADESLTQRVTWSDGTVTRARRAFYRIVESLERAGVDAAAAASATPRGLAADLMAPATAVRWDLQGLLATLPDSAWDADPGSGEWPIRHVVGHIIGGQRGYAVEAAWWQTQGFRADDDARPRSVPESVFADLPSDEEEAAGSVEQVRDLVGHVLDLSTERLAGLTTEQLALGAGWAGMHVDVGFIVGRWASHTREHTIQVEKTLVMLEIRPTEVQRLVRLVLATWGRAEATIYGATASPASTAILSRAAADARSLAGELKAAISGR
jgi:hypothetical protein